MITTEELETIKNLFEDMINTRNLTDSENNILEKINILIEYDNVEKDFRVKRDEISKRLENLSK